MKTVGVDIGSRTIKFVLVRDGEILFQELQETGYQPVEKIQAVLKNLRYDRLVATGYGRGLLEISAECQTVTEIKAFARGIYALYPDASTILDIGGQDCKVISLARNGKILKFEMNDRCAAGTGKFLEIMAKTLGLPLSEFGEAALKSKNVIQITNMCTVFAESEVVSLIAQNKNRVDIARAVHEAVFKRVSSMLKRSGRTGHLIFAGGGALNPCLAQLVRKFWNNKVSVPPAPQMVGAYGAALLGEDEK